eukprot:267330-Rhodomonas_salina.1
MPVISAILLKTPFVFALISSAMPFATAAAEFRVRLGDKLPELSPDDPSLCGLAAAFFALPPLFLGLLDGL